MNSLFIKQAQRRATIDHPQLTYIYSLYQEAYLPTKFQKKIYIGPIPDDRLKEKILKPWKGALSSHPVCLSVCLCVCVCPSVNGLQVTPFDLGT